MSKAFNAWVWHFRHPYDSKASAAKKFGISPSNMYQLKPEVIEQARDMARRQQMKFDPNNSREQQLKKYLIAFTEQQYTVQAEINRCINDLIAHNNYLERLCDGLRAEISSLCQESPEVAPGPDSLPALPKLGGAPRPT